MHEMTDGLKEELEAIKEEEWYVNLLACNPDLDLRVKSTEVEEQRLLLYLHAILELIEDKVYLRNPIVLGTFMRRAMEGNAGVVLLDVINTFGK